MNECLLARCVEAAERDLCRPHLLRLAWTCYGKRRRNESNARTEARVRGVGSAAYSCPVCNTWHIGRLHPGQMERRSLAVAIVKELRMAREVGILSRFATGWDPRHGADRAGAWIEHVERRSSEERTDPADWPREHYSLVPHGDARKEKRDFLSREAAEPAARVYGKRAYQCTYCLGWHIGNRKPEER